MGRGGIPDLRVERDIHLLPGALRALHVLMLALAAAFLVFGRRSPRMFLATGYGAVVGMFFHEYSNAPSTSPNPFGNPLSNPPANPFERPNPFFDTRPSNTWGQPSFAPPQRPPSNLVRAFSNPFDRGPSAYFDSVAISPTGRLIAAGVDGATSVLVWVAAAAQVVRTLTLRGNGGYVQRVAFSPDEAWVAASNGATITIWNMQTGRVERMLSSPKLLWSFAFSPKGNWIAAGSEDHTTTSRADDCC